MISREPFLTVEKASERLSQSSFRVGLVLRKLVESKPWRKVSSGAEERMLNTDARLLCRPFPSAGKRKPLSTGAPHVLMLLTNSYPYSQSGYAERSHKILEAMEAGGLSVLPVTRFQYPYVVGKIPSSYADRWGTVTYIRLTSWFLPPKKAAEDMKMVRFLVHRARESKADVIHTTTGDRNAWIAAQAAAILGIPWTYEVRGEPHNTWLSKFPVNQQHLMRESRYYKAAAEYELSAMRAADSVFVLSQVSKEEIEAQGIPREKIVVVPNSVTKSEVEIGLDRLRTADPRPFQAKESVVVGTVSSLVDYEGLEVLLQAIPYLPPRVSCLIVGDGRILPDLKKLVRELGIQDRVQFPGRVPVEEAEHWYKKLDVFVIPRRDTEVCRNVTPLKGLRALAYGIPVVATDLPALREVTGNLGQYCTPDDAVALAQGIKQVLNLDGQELSMLRRASIEWASSRTWESAAEAFNKRFKQVSNSVV
ncbi:glycosyltransferase [Corynebacterium incognita]|uniref:Glycosyltransferase n=1 Tax=Corynebacterium incognita TaxID=2754725 RepID=A0A7G7CQU3_9CORY|nr:glycosyltransferase [Corynebacterium incognita]QNE89959.1 glycosyltransferase [Corynebacterium incognita]